MSAEMVRQLLALLDELKRSATRAVVLTGAGRGFCAGSDLGELADMDLSKKEVFEAECGRLARRMVAYDFPIVVAVDGFAIGGGLTLAAACDIVVTAPHAKWSLPEVPIGLFPAWGLEPVIARIGRARARRLAWGIETWTGTEAALMGLADLTADDPLAEALAIAEKLAALPRAQAAAVKSYFADGDVEKAGDAKANRRFVHACGTDEAAAIFERYIKR